MDIYALVMLDNLLPDGVGGLEALASAGPLSDASNLYFFREVYGFLGGEIDEFRENVLGRVMSWVGTMALILMTLWIMVQGYRIVIGQSRESMAALVTNTLRATLIVSIATSFAIGGTSLNTLLTDDLNREITHVVTGHDENAYDSIDRSLGHMQLAMSSIDALDVGGSELVDDAKTRTMWFTGIGIAGPAITGGALLLLNKIAMALVVGFGPVFILCLLFDQTKQLFSKWLFYGIGTLFSLAVLSVMVALALDMVLAVSAAFWAGNFPGANQEGISSMAMQQGGLGLILTVLIVTAPPMAASFFSGVLGQFSAYNQFANPSIPPGQNATYRFTGHVTPDAGLSAAPAPVSFPPILALSSTTASASLRDEVRPHPRRVAPGEP
jgi:type IV secretion system protein VirB6